MPRLEYRLYHNPSQVICHYEDMTVEELLIRNSSDWFVREGIIYERQRNENQNGVHLIYVNISDETTPSEPDADRAEGIKVEIREFREGDTHYPLLQLQRYKSLLDVLLLLQTDAFEWNGQKWNKSSFEIDEDRKIFVYYAQH